MTVLETQIGCITYANSALPWLPGARGWKRTSSGKRRLINGVCHSGQEVAVGVPHLCCLRSIRWNVRFQFIQPFSAFLGVSALSSNPLTIHLSGTCTAFASLVFPKTLCLLPRSGCVCGFFLRYELVYNTNLTCLHFLRMSEGSQDFRQTLNSEAGRGIHPWSLPTLESNTELWSLMPDHVWLWA